MLTASESGNTFGADAGKIYGSDYPHPDGTWPESMRFPEQELRDVPERVRRK